jgi:hypothetical protein
MTPLPGWGGSYILKAAGSSVGSSSLVFDYELADGAGNVEAGLERLRLLEAR